MQANDADVVSKEISYILHFYSLPRYDSSLKKQVRVMGLGTGAPGVALPRRHRKSLLEFTPGNRTCLKFQTEVKMY